MTQWRSTFRGLARLMSREGLTALLTALEADDPRLVQGVTVRPLPPPWQEAEYAPVEAACAVSLTGWLGDGLPDVLAVDDYFATICRALDNQSGESGHARWFLNWFDEMPREQMREQLIPEVRFALGLGSDPVLEGGA